MDFFLHMSLVLESKKQTSVQGADHLIKCQGLTVAIYCGQEKNRPQRVQPIWSLNRAVTNSSDNPVSGANIVPECLKLNGDLPGPAWQIVSDWQSVCLPTNFQMSNKKDYGINTLFLLLLFSPSPPPFPLREIFTVPRRLSSY